MVLGHRLESWRCSPDMFLGHHSIKKKQKNILTLPVLNVVQSVIVYNNEIACIIITRMEPKGKMQQTIHQQGRGPSEALGPLGASNKSSNLPYT